MTRPSQRIRDVRDVSYLVAAIVKVLWKQLKIKVGNKNPTDGRQGLWKVAWTCNKLCVVKINIFFLCVLSHCDFGVLCYCILTWPIRTNTTFTCSYTWYVIEEIELVLQYLCNSFSWPQEIAMMFTFHMKWIRLLGSFLIVVIFDQYFWICLFSVKIYGISVSKTTLLLFY